MPPYNEQELSFADINLREIGVRTSTLKEPNHFETFWQNSEVDLAAGLDFTADSGLHASYTHLQHAPFEYCFVVENKSEHVKSGTCRIFLCPKTDERGKPLKLEEQRLLTIELDKFTVKRKWLSMTWHLIVFMCVLFCLQFIPAKINWSVFQWNPPSPSPLNAPSAAPPIKTLWQSRIRSSTHVYTSAVAVGQIICCCPKAKLAACNSICLSWFRTMPAMWSSSGVSQEVVITGKCRH